MPDWDGLVTNMNGWNGDRAKKSRALGVGITSMVYMFHNASASYGYADASPSNIYVY